MEFWMSLQGLAATHRVDLDSELKLLQAEIERSRRNLREIESRAVVVQALLDLAQPRGDKAEADALLTLHEAMREVLLTAPEYMMRAGDLATEIQRRRLYAMRDGRPVEAQQIHARVGHYGHMFEKVGTFIQLREQHR